MKRVLVGLALLLSLGFAAGDALYQQNCASCHGQDGTGTPNFAPPLAATLPALLQTEDGRAYLASVVLWGLQGQIKVNDQTYNAPMPPFGRLTDAEIAEILNYILTAWGNDALLPEGFTPYTADEIAELRKTQLTPQDVLKQRPNP
ncbi:c-type cytochrome [Marinithermus hydrothermalis]|uniref:Cytochrome c class I n=1 Tax=Marinithermus hydrothermalis (strain DSM 14884 / JCM 11576 / T1) TaxID=869210 RepID=F2NQZ0_MARHT|nr:cytochrome c [Marinithermus hydrothermalis]AEB12568.1 cytochrome c class I [Marinithermus hydrothermalis DSM 14884]